MIYYNYAGLDRGNCSTVIIGKNASVTGHVILGHNEDDTECMVQSHLVPRQQHKEGEMVVFEDGKAIIPQVPETYAYYWSEVKCVGGISFADVFMNENGVALVSNAARPTMDATGSHKDNREAYGLGYALRTLVAQRAKTARQGVEVAMELVEKYGYCSSRIYHIVDKDEAWSVQVPKGFNCVARRIKDDEVYYMPNHLTIHQIDFNDPDNFKYTKNIVTHAIEQGWYKPAVEGDYSDFDFAKVYQEDELQERNWFRGRNAWRMLTGIELTKENIRQFSQKAERKYSKEDVKAVLRTHFEGTEDDRTAGGTANPHKGYDSFCPVCNNATVESSIFEFNDDIYLTRMYRAMPRPCCNPYTPWYPVALTRVPKGYEYLDVHSAKLAHFDVDKTEIKYDPSKAWFGFLTVQMISDMNWKFAAPVIKEARDAIEAGWDKEQAGVEAGYKAALECGGLEAAREYLTGYTCAQAQKAWDWALDTVDELYYKRLRDDLYD